MPKRDSRSFGICTTSPGDSFRGMLKTLTENGAQGLDENTIKFAPSLRCGGSLGCFAAKSFSEGEVIFSIPLSLMFGLNQCIDTPTSRLLRAFDSESGSIQASPRVTSELLIWIGMIHQSEDPSSEFYHYFNSLDAVSPSPMCWPVELLEALAETNIKPSMDDAKRALLRHCDFIVAAHAYYKAAGNVGACRLLDPSLLSFQKLLWARGTYLSRRYPGNLGPVPLGCLDGREDGLGSLGVLVPVLDILNHDASHDYLLLQTPRIQGGTPFIGIDQAHFLQVVCQRACGAGEELFSNYGRMGNEQLLFAFGFAFDDNEHETVAVRPRLPPSMVIPGKAHSLGTHLVKRGGISGVPRLLWKALGFCCGRNEFASAFTSTVKGLDHEKQDGDEGEVEVGLDEIEALWHFANNKLSALKKSAERAQEIIDAHATEYKMECGSIVAYRHGQEEVFAVLVEELAVLLEEEKEGEEEGGGEEDHPILSRSKLSHHP